MPSTLPQPHFSIRDPTPPLTHNIQRQGLPLWPNKPLDTTSGGSMSWPVPLRDGLPTPPGDMTGVAYNTTATSSDHVGKSCGLPISKYPSLSSMSQSNLDSRSGATRVPASKVRSQAPSSQNGSASETTEQKKSSNGSIASYLQIPSSINDSKGSLAEFAAQITCLFWFEKTTKLKAIEDRMAVSYSLVPEAIPTIGFQKWVTTILSTTQVSQNVILLALLFIYRLKKFNPGVRGKKGSEFRLMTIALMMGNKFLDDNTYTNKTWAEVSGISVDEIHIMEVEFLSNVRYNLFVSKEEWTQWHVKLDLFSDYFNKASRMPAENELTATTPVLQLSPSLVPTSNGRNVPSSPASKLPSPPVTGHFPVQPSWNPSFNGLPYPSRSPPRQVPETESRPASRKRNWDDQLEGHPAKKIAVSNNYPTHMSNLAPVSMAPVSMPTGATTLPPVLMPTSMPPTTVPSMSASVPRLPRPDIPLTSASMGTNAPLPISQVPQLPLPGGRPMSSVYNPPTTWTQQLPAPTSVAPPSGIYNGPISLPDPGRRQSPFTLPSGTVSPALSAYSVHNPQTHLSPSFFLTNRNSPYRPVRAVNTLLIPPPSASLHHPRTLSFDQMRYQPIGKTPSERKTGVLPYLQHEAWPQGPIAQPNFLAGHNYHS
ncbi:hypothetical protein DTO169E5_4479 [Paecilomyces variotii]|nr:hypothetical protein DTO169E5_4479 [Paecilomyces variotii]KAJ9403083.1 hypothetical protein DTO045G8_9182 [Paecilomyces variotii]